MEGVVDEDGLDVTGQNSLSLIILHYCVWYYRQTMVCFNKVLAVKYIWNGLKQANPVL